MTRPLFRAAAIEAQKNSLQGGVLIATPPSLALLVLAAVLAGVLVLAYGFWGEYTRKEHVSGFLVPTQGLIRIHSPRVGTIIERSVDEGQQVRRGDVLLRVTSELATAHTEGAHAASLVQLGRRRDNLRAVIANQTTADSLALNALAARIRSLESELDQAQAQHALQAKRVASAERSLKRYSELVKAKFVSEATLQLRQDELLDQQSLLAGHVRSLTALARELDEARAALESARMRQPNNLAALEREILELEQELTEGEARREVLVTAPADGTVTSVLTDVGQRVDPDMPLLSILPLGASLEATLLVPTRAAGFIRAGQTVALRYQAFPYQRFGHHEGEVVAIGRALIQPGEVRMPAMVQEPAYPVTVRLAAQEIHAYGQALALQPGMLLDADVRIERRRLIEWMFDPVLAIAGRV